MLPVGPRPPNPSELLSSPRFREVICTLRDSGVTVVIDSPPVLEESDGMVVAGASNAAVLVTSVRTGSRRRLRRALALLDRAGTPYVGVVLNRAGKERVGIETAHREPNLEPPSGEFMPEDSDRVNPTVEIVPHENGAGRVGADGIPLIGR